MRVVVSGSRGWTDEKAIFDRLSLLPVGTIVVHGDAPRGVDRIVDAQARKLGFAVERWAADWERFGKAAGPIRNLAMLNSRPALVLAFWDGESRGTKHCIEAAIKKEIPIEVIYPKEQQ